MSYNFQSVVALTVLAAFLTICVHPSQAQEELECRGQPINMTMEQKAVIMDCLASAGVPSIMKIPMEKLACLGVCVLEKKNLLTADGKLDHDKILKYIYDVMKPDEVKKLLVDGTEKCMKERGENIKKANDPTCQSFMETGQCVHDLFFEVCVVD